MSANKGVSIHVSLFGGRQPFGSGKGVWGIGVGVWDAWFKGGVDVVPAEVSEIFEGSEDVDVDDSEGGIVELVNGVELVLVGMDADC